jgi:hypothetical protein
MSLDLTDLHAWGDLITNVVVIGGLLYFVFKFRTIRRDAEARKTSIIDELTLGQAIADIKRELRKLERKPEAWLGLELSEVELKLAVEDEKGTSGELSVPVVDEGSLGRTDKLTDKVGSTVTVVLAPPTEERYRGLGAEIEGLQLKFAAVIDAALKALKASMDTEPRLAAKSITVALEFVFTRALTGKAEIKAKVLSIGANIDRTSVASNTFTLTYKNPDYKE